MSELSVEPGVDDSPSQPKRRGPLIKIMMLMVLGMLTLSAASAWWLMQWAQAPIEQLSSQQFRVVKGDNVATISRRLKRAGQFATIWPLRWLLLKEPELAQLRAGTYRLEARLSPRALLQHLSNGREIQFSLTFVEGTTFKQWQQQLAADPNIDFSTEQIIGFKRRDPATQLHGVAGYDNSWIEGRLYPDTYSFTAGTPASAILSRAAKMLNHELAQAWQQRAPGLPLSSPYQALILASIIEKETGTGSERSTIASVFINRINKKMRLQTDPTVIYGVGDSYDGDITRVHLRDKNPYNTYVIRGLPPTPIAMPGRESIIAALHPAKTDYLYFVAQGDGSHYFSKTLNEHNRAVRRYLLSQTDQ